MSFDPPILRYTPFEEIAQVKAIARSITQQGDILDTFQLRYPRMVHADFMTHRVFSRNASSSRAIPYKSLVKRDADFYIPRFRQNQPGMQPAGYLSDEDQARAEAIWQDMAQYCLARTAELSIDLNIHKQWVNRPLEWFGFIDVVVSTTNWTNFSGLRNHSDAQDEIEALAIEVDHVRAATPVTLLKPGEFHLPYVLEQDRDDASKALHDKVLSTEGQALVQAITNYGTLMRDVPNPELAALLIATSAARACRVSYSNHDGTPSNFESDLKRYALLADSVPVHASPLEHQARPLTREDAAYLAGNFEGWAQYRKFAPNEFIATQNA